MWISFFIGIAFLLQAVVAQKSDLNSKDDERVEVTLSRGDVDSFYEALKFVRGVDSDLLKKLGAFTNPKAHSIAGFESRATRMQHRGRSKAKLHRLRRLSSDIEQYEKDMGTSLDTMWLLICGTFVFFMHAGFSMLEVGSVRAKNVQHISIKNLITVCVGTIGWYILGWSLAYGGDTKTVASWADGTFEDCPPEENPMGCPDGYADNGFIGGTHMYAGSGFLGKGNVVDNLWAEGTIDPTTNPQPSECMWFFQWAFCTAGASIVSGGIAERVKLPGYMFFTLFMTAFIYPVIVCSTWGYGWLETFKKDKDGNPVGGYMDFAGSGVVHLCGGSGALVGAIIIGRRTGRFDPALEDEFQPNSIPFVVLGTFVLWFGWCGFNSGSTLTMSDDSTAFTAAMVMMNTTLSAACGGLTVLLLQYAISRKYDCAALCNGILAGLVSITAGCSNVESGSAVLIGMLGGSIYVASARLIKKFEIDDPVDACCVHGACGIWGCLAAALFDFGHGTEKHHGWGGFSATSYTEDGEVKYMTTADALTANVCEILFVISWSGGLSALAFGGLRFAGLLRVDEDTEKLGCDAACAGAQGYNLHITDEMKQIKEVLDKERSRLAAGVQSKGYNNNVALMAAERKLRSSKKQLDEVGSPRGDGNKKWDDSEYGSNRTRADSGLSDDEHQKAATVTARTIVLFSWGITIVTAVVVALQCGGMILLSHKLTQMVLSLAAFVSGDFQSGGAAFCVMLCYALLAGFPSALLVTYIAPHAGGSGIPDLKAHMNGNALTNAFGLKAFFSRSLGLVLVTSAGFFAGTEGPFAHIGGMVGAGLSQGPPGPLKNLLYWPLQLSGHQAQCEFIAQGAAIGVSAAFGAPVGGVLFTLEEASTFWCKDLTWRSFVGAMVACLFAKLVKNEFKGLGVGGFIEFPDVEASFAIWELIPFAFVGIATGFLGSMFCAIAKAIGSTRRKKFNLGSPQKRHKIGRVVEVLVIAIITLTVIFWVPMLLKCKDLQPERALASTAVESSRPSYVGEMPATICPEGQYSDVAAILLAPKEKAIKALFTRSFTRGADFEFSGLVVAGCIVYILTLLTFGSAIPAGLFIPNILAGACFGRAIGEELLMLDMEVHPGIYAVMGAAGMLAGFSRMTISLTMIMLEITGNMRMLLPLMLVIMIAKSVADRFTVSVYDIILELNPSIHMLESNMEVDRVFMLDQFDVHDVCSSDVKALAAVEPLSAIVRVLSRTSYGGFPVVDDDHHVLGLVQRPQLAQILFEHAVEEWDDEMPSPKSPKSPGSNPQIHILDYADTSPETIHWAASVSRAFRQFTATGIQYLCVVDEYHTLKGILTRTDFSKLTAHGAHGRKHVQEILKQKTGAKEGKSGTLHQRRPEKADRSDPVASVIGCDSHPIGSGVSVYDISNYPIGKGSKDKYISGTSSHETCESSKSGKTYRENLDGCQDKSSSSNHMTTSIWATSSQSEGGANSALPGTAVESPRNLAKELEDFGSVPRERSAHEIETSAC